MANWQTKYVYMGKTVDFSGFSVDRQTHQLFQSGNRVEITSTAYKLLAYFLEHPGSTISRQALTDHIWTNRIVSETSLDKLIQRLRKTLGDTGQHKDIIGTIHGEGFVFLAKIKQTDSKEKKTKIPYKFLTFILLPIFLLVYYANTDLYKPDDIQIISQAEANPMVLALIPNITTLKDSNQSWMTQGGLHYLNEKFKSAIGVKVKNISLEKIDNQIPERFSINLISKKRTDSTIIISVNEQNQTFYAVAILRNADGIIAENKFNAETIKSIYDNIYSWTLNEFNTTEKVKSTTYEKTLSDNRYAVENYVRGIAAQVTGDAQLAIKYFELAIDEDQKFWLAWYQLSVSYRKQGLYDKAMSIVKTFEQANIDNSLKIMVLNSKVSIHNAQGDFDTGIQTIEQAIELAKTTDNRLKLPGLLLSRAYGYSQLRKFQLAVESIVEAINLTEKYDDDNNEQLGRAYSTLSGIQLNMNNINLAEKSTQTAIEYIIKSGNKRYAAKLKLRLSSIVAKQGQWGKSENLLSESLITLKDLNSLLEYTTTYMRLIDLQLMTGKHNLAKQNYEILSGLMTSISSKNQMNFFLITKIDLMLHTNQLKQAKSALDQLKQDAISDYQRMNYYLLAMRYYKKTNNKDRWLDVAKEFTTVKAFIGNPLVYITQAQIAIKENNTLLAINAFEQARVQALKMNSIRVASAVFNPYIEHLLQQNKLNQTQEVFLELEKFKVFPYPYLKYKAQLLLKQKNYFKANSILEELKSIAGDLWSVDDQLLLEQFHRNIK